MQQKQRGDILLVLSKTIQAVEQGDVKTIKFMSDRIIDSAGIFQDEDTITITVVIYSLSKIFARDDYKKYKDWNLFYENTINNLRDAHSNLKSKNIPAYRKNLKNLTKGIDKLSTKLKSFIKDVLEKSHISKGSRLYEHGISLGRAAEILGISKWELMDYVGKTGIPDVKENINIPIARRLKKARSLFR
ncbi:MAG: UPF0175 family protein [Nanoarchaeota archaeon]|nr:UPF0175 family protein [Nanoarchaeota archaeon]